MTALQRLFLWGMIGLALFGRPRQTWPQEVARPFYVGPKGSDRSGNGTLQRPWASLVHATDSMPDGGAELVFLDGTYGPQSLRRAFTRPVVIRAQHPYQVRWMSTPSHHRVLHVEGAKEITLSGFEMRGTPGGNDGYLIQITGGETGSILLHDNIIHDSYKNDIVKINARAHHIRLLGNLFYNQPRGGDEHLDVNTVHDVMIEDNVFFNDYKASGRPVLNITHPFVLIKNSGDQPISRNFLVRGNIFLNWQGRPDEGFLMLGEDAKPFFEAENVLIENNLFLGNSRNGISAVFTVSGVKDVKFRSNTIHGNLPLGSDDWAFAMRLTRYGPNPKNVNILFANNIWSDPTGTMTHLSSGRPENSTGVSLLNCLYYNGGRPIPVDRGRVLNVTDDPRAIVKDPGLPASLRAVVPPSWNPTAHRFADGSTTIEEVHKSLVVSFGTPSEGSPVIDAANPGETPKSDILRRPRGTSPDIGAVEVRP
ncbi:MAG: choice-of-anchor Q domain-containing protein [Isosphaeraceae bacterium]